MTGDSGVRLRVVAYSDYVCPWCYIGLERIDRLRGEFGIEVEWRPFELHPETPKTGADLRGRLGNSERVRAYTGNILNLAAESGIAMEMPEVVANSHRSLEAAEFAREAADAAVFDRFHHGLFGAYFAGCDLGDIDVLGEIARECGVDDQGLRGALADERYAGVVDAITQSAREAEIVSTPTFVFTTERPGGDRLVVPEGFRLTGAQEYAVFGSVTGRLLSRLEG